MSIFLSIIRHSANVYFPSVSLSSLIIYVSFSLCSRSDIHHAGSSRNRAERTRARKLKDLIARGGNPRGCLRSISTCMRNAVASFTIMWVYKRALSLSLSPRSHTFTKLRTLGRAQVPFSSLLFYVEPRGRLFILPPTSFETSTRKRGNGTRASPPLRDFNFLRFFSVRDKIVQLLENMQFIREVYLESNEERFVRAYYWKIYFIYWMTILFEIIMIDFFLSHYR